MAMADIDTFSDNTSAKSTDSAESSSFASKVWSECKSDYESAKKAVSSATSELKDGVLDFKPNDLAKLYGDDASNLEGGGKASKPQDKPADASSKGDVTGDHSQWSYKKDNGQPGEITVVDENGKKTTYRYGIDNKYNEVDDKGNTKPNGKVLDGKFGDTSDYTDAAGVKHRVATVDVTDSNGVKSTHTFDINSGKEVERSATGSPLKEKFINGEPSGYEFNKNNHSESLTKNADGSWTLTRGSDVQTFPKDSKVDIDPHGDRKVTRPDGSSFEGKADGTTIERDSKGHITKETNAEGNVTTIKRDANGDPSSIEVKDGQGKVVEHSEKTDKGWSTTIHDAAGKTVDVQDIKVNDKDGSYSVSLKDGSHLDRKVDGSENRLDANGNSTDTKADEAVKKMKELNPKMTDADEKQLRADLAEINKLPPEQRKHVLESLDKIAGENTDKTTKLSAEQREQLYTSLAHQVAHPEDIKQGNKDTCVAANSEKAMAMKHPDQYADMVATLATKGEYTITKPDGEKKTIHVQTDEKGQLMGVTDSNHSRSLTSEVFQNFAMNTVMKDGETYVSYEPGHKPLPKGVSASNDTGERIVKDSPWFWQDKENKFNGLDRDSKEQMLKTLMPGDMYKSQDVNSAADLEKAWNAAGQQPPMEVTVSINNNEGKFLGMGDAGSGAGTHAITVTHIETGPDGRKYVYYENTADGDDHSWPKGKGVPIDDFVTDMKKANGKAIIPTACAAD
jgi:YD repeat-containing protein